MSRIQPLWIPDMESFEPYVRSLCHMARAMDNNGLDYGKNKKVVVIGLSKRSVESYIKHLLNASTLPSLLVCYGIDEDPTSHTKYSYSGSHMVLMHDLRYCNQSALGQVAKRTLSILEGLKSSTGNTDSALSIVYQNPILWKEILEHGNKAAENMESKHVSYQSNLVSTISIDSLMRCNEVQDFQALHADVITIGVEFLCVDPTNLLDKVKNLLWSLGSETSAYKKNHRIVFHEYFRHLFFEEYILRDFKGF